MQPKRFGIVAIAAFALVGCSSGPTAIETAAEDCGLQSLVADDGHTLTLHTEGKEYASDYTIIDLACVLAALETPQDVLSHMDMTSSNDGQQTDEWADFGARWTYHPDNGMTVTITEG